VGEKSFLFLRCNHTIDGAFSFNKIHHPFNPYCRITVLIDDASLNEVMNLTAGMTDKTLFFGLSENDAQGA